MFTPANMSQVDIFVYEQNIIDVARAVAGLGVIHLIDAKELGKWSSETDGAWAGRVAQYANQERRLREILQQLGVAERLGECPQSLDPVKDLTTTERELDEVEGRVSALREREIELNRELQRWALVSQSMEQLSHIWVSITELRQLQHLHLVLGMLPAENMARLEASLFRIPYNIIPVHEEGGRALVFAFCAQEHAPILDRALESAFLERLTLPQEFNGTAQEVLQQVTEHRSVTQAGLEEVHAGYAEIAQEVGTTLHTLLARIRSDRAVAEAMTHFGHRGAVYLIAGWVPSNRVAELHQVVEEASQGRATIEETPARQVAGDGKTVPTLLRNPRALRAAESLVATYGVPGYREIDPTPLVAVTFVIMFGVMFGDLGHGMILAAIGTVLALGLVPSLKKMAETGMIVLACGLSSSLFGVLYGSVFGMEDVIQHVWLSPMNNILDLLLASVVLGVVVLNIGYGCRLATAIRQGKIKHAIFDKNGLVGWLLYWSILVVVLLIATGRAAPGVLFALIATLILALFFTEPLTHLITGKRPLWAGNMVENLVQAFFELFEAMIGYLSNTLSYVRLGAFAVAHAGLSMVVFLLADMIASGSSGWLLRLAVIVAGNIFIIGFEGLIVAIQTLRLEYYELFGKFYSGEGFRFKPLTLPTVECQATDNN